MLRLVLAVVGLGFVATLVWLGSVLDGQHREIERLQARVSELEDEVGEALVAPASGRAAAPVARRPGAATSADAPPEPLRLAEQTRARLLAAPQRDGVLATPEDREVRDALLDVLATEDPELREGFRNLVREEQQALRDEWREQRQTRWEQRTVQRIEQLASEHGLSQSQQDGLFALLTATRDRIGEVMRQARESEEPVTREEMRQKVQAIREEADAEARTLLDEKQYEAYEAAREEEGFRGGPGGPGGGPGRGGRRGGAPPEE